MNILTFVIVLIGWIFSLCLHEFSHTLVAYLGGDTTVKDKGYLTFNPLKYTHPVYSSAFAAVVSRAGRDRLARRRGLYRDVALAESQLDERGFAGGSDCESDSRHHPWTRVALRARDFKRTLARPGFSRPVASHRGRIEI